MKHNMIEHKVREIKNHKFGYCQYILGKHIPKYEFCFLSVIQLCFTFNVLLLMFINSLI
jgi:hypothetical protein